MNGEARSFGSFALHLPLVGWKELPQTLRTAGSPPMRKVSTMWSTSCCALLRIMSAVRSCKDSLGLTCHFSLDGILGFVLTCGQCFSHCCSVLSLFPSTVGCNSMGRLWREAWQAGWNPLNVLSSAFFFFEGGECFFRVGVANQRTDRAVL